MKQGKVFEIPKELVWQSWLQVRANKGSAGSDGQTLKEFEENRNRNLYKIWNRLSSGSYFPPPVLEKRIPKGDGKERVLGIPTVADRVAQGAVRIHLERILDPLFDDDSYGNRPTMPWRNASGGAGCTTGFWKLTSRPSSIVCATIWPSKPLSTMGCRNGSCCIADAGWKPRRLGQSPENPRRLSQINL